MCICIRRWKIWNGEFSLKLSTVLHKQILWWDFHKISCCYRAKRKKKHKQSLMHKMPTRWRNLCSVKFSIFLPVKPKWLWSACVFDKLLNGQICSLIGWAVLQPNDNIIAPVVFLPAKKKHLKIRDPDLDLDKFRLIAQYWYLINVKFIKTLVP